MAFAFIVEDGTGLSVATSYVDVAEADAVAEESLKLGEAWAKLDEDEKRRALAYGTRILDTGFIWSGRRRTAAQALDWPRSDARDSDGYDIPPDAVPRKVRAAAVFVALHSLANDPATLDKTRRVQRLKADSVEVEFRHDEIGQPSTIPLFVREMLTGYGQTKAGSRSGKVVRA